MVNHVPLYKEQSHTMHHILHICKNYEQYKLAQFFVL
jgi:hypothetical protein